MSKNNVKNNSGVVIKCLIVTIVMMVICGGGMYVLAKHRQTSSYEAKRSVLISHSIQINRQADSDNNQSNSSDFNMMPTYKNIAENQMVARVARHSLPHKLQKKYSAEELSNMVDAHVSQQSLVLRLSVTNSNKNDAVKLVNATARGLKKELPVIQPGAGEVRLLAPASKRSVVDISSHHTKKYVAVGLAFGALLGLIISFFYVTWLKLL